MKYENKRAHREYLFTFVFGIVALFAVVLHAYYMNTMLYKARVANDRNFQEYIKELNKKEVIINDMKNEMKGMIKKPVIKKKILPPKTCK